MSGSGRTARRALSTLRAGGGSTAHGLLRAFRPDGRTRLSPARLHHVDPDEVTHVTRVRLPERTRGRRSGGDWDVEAVALSTLALTRVLTARFVDGLGWEEAGLRVGVDLQEGVPNLGSRYVGLDAAGLARRGEELDRLHASLTRDGWLPHHATGAPFHRELAVAIGRDGRLVRNSGGLHRLLLARIIGLDHIPVRVLTEHPLLEATPAALRTSGRTHRRSHGRSRGGAPRGR